MSTLYSPDCNFVRIKYKEGDFSGIEINKVPINGLVSLKFEAGNEQIQKMTLEFYCRLIDD